MFHFVFAYVGSKGFSKTSPRSRDKYLATWATRRKKILNLRYPRDLISDKIRVKKINPFLSGCSKTIKRDFKVSRPTDVKPKSKFKKKKNSPLPPPFQTNLVAKLLEFRTFCKVDFIDQKFDTFLTILARVTSLYNKPNNNIKY